MYKSRLLRGRGFSARRIKWRGSRSLAARLYLGFCLVLVLLALVVGLGWMQTGALAARIGALVDEDEQRSELSSEMQIDVKDMVLALSNLCLVDDPQDVAFEVKRLKEANDRYANAKSQLKKLLLHRNVDDQILDALKGIESIETAASQLFGQAAALAERGSSKTSLADFVTTQTAGPQQQWVDALDRLKQALLSAAHKSANQSLSSATAMRTGMAAAGALALLIGMLAAFVITRSVIRPVRQAVEFARRIEAGDLTAELAIGTQDEIGVLLRALGSMQDSLNRIVHEIRECADSINVASSEVAAGNLDLSHRTEMTAGALQEAASSLQQLTDVVRESADSAVVATELAGNASRAAQRGGTVVAQVVSSMSEISTSSGKMADIVGVIDAIAFQTNILALNASVEAARAGDQGRGFSVVATEVRYLAQRSALSAREINVLIKSSGELVNAGSRLVSEAGATIRQVVEEAERVATTIREVTSAASLQSNGLQDVYGSISQLDTMTQQNAALVEQSAAAAESLRKQAERLNGLVSSFQLRTAHS